MGSRNRVNLVTHVLGALLAVVGGAFLIVPAALRGEETRAYSFALYAVALLSSFVASALFHSLRGPAKKVLRRCDRVAIYILIGATYTPIALLCLPRGIGIPLLAVVWALVAVGIATDLLASVRRTPVSVGLYLLLGWLILLVFRPLAASITPWGIALIVFGGAIITIGALVLRFRWTPRTHEVWHVLVLVGSTCFFAVMAFFVP